jgi:hypothetical protein
MLFPPFRAKISLPFFGKICFTPIRPASPEGRIAIVTDVERGMRWTRVCQRAIFARTNDMIADGEVVWSWPPDAEAKLRGTFRATTGARKPGPRGEPV